ncbi:hypothetical protein D3C75_1374010 [compost metagenome]
MKMYKSAFLYCITQSIGDQLGQYKSQPFLVRSNRDAAVYGNGRKHPFADEQPLLL